MSTSLNPLDHGRYVVLYHDGVADPHFDLMFERAEVDTELVTFRSPNWPVTNRTALLKLANHRLAYLTYEGPVSGNRGSVRRVESGWYESFKAGEGIFTVSLSSKRTLQLKRVSDTEWRMEPIA